MPDIMTEGKPATTRPRAACFAPLLAVLALVLGG